MLGSLGGTKGAWRWGAFGKHPTARDYFDIGTPGPILKAFSDWIETGYQLLVSQKNISPEPCSWRFWVKSGAKDSLACGLVKESCDSVGRSYPLLIMGTGPLKDWTGHWDLLPLACEQTWSHMEFISARRFTDFRDLEEEVGIIRAPSGEWSALSTAGQPHESFSDEGLLEKLCEEAEKDRFWVPLDRMGAYDPKDAASALHRYLKKHSDPPNAVFVGGVMRSGYVAVFRRALRADDFVQLWTLGGNGLHVSENG